MSDAATTYCRSTSFEDLWEASLYAEGLRELDGRRHDVTECFGCEGYHVAGT
ncbi:MAG: hypothetical protein KGM44_01985 [bacterium]|nr:hypothetical protein [bacterium]